MFQKVASSKCGTTMIHRVHKQSGQRQQSTVTLTSGASKSANLTGRGKLAMSEERHAGANYTASIGGDPRPPAIAPSTATQLLAEVHDDREASAIQSPVRHDRTERNKRRILVNMVCITLAGALTLVLTGEGLTNILGSLARITPLVRHSEPGRVASWTETVAGCTGPEDGYVYGGDAGKVLTFVRMGRGREREEGLHHAVGNGGSGGSRPALPEVLRWFWKLKRDRGVLAYEVEELEMRRGAAGQSGWEVVFASNIGRHKLFPPAGPAEAPWDPSSFNFYKASPLEFLLSYTPSFRYEREAVPPAAAGATAEEAARMRQPRALNSFAGGSIGAEVETRRATSAAAAGQEKMAAEPALRGAIRGNNKGSGAGGGDLHPQSAATEAIGSAGVSSVGCAEASTASPPQDAVLVNIRPVGPVSLLLTPGYPDSHNQRAAAESLAVAMDFAEELITDPGFRLGFNSAGSSASVNHLHFQCWHFDAGPGGLPIEASASTHLATVPLPLRRGASFLPTEEKGVTKEGGSVADRDIAKEHELLEVHTLTGYPIRTLVFHTLGKDLEAVGEVMERCVNFLVEENTPHTVVFSTGRAFLLPRQHLVEPPFAVVPGFPEVSGEIIVTKEEDFRTITADQVYEWWTDKIGVSAEHFDRISVGCLK